jgi:DNA-directed RNA polymerase specialized sigma24 family protein
MTPDDWDEAARLMNAFYDGASQDSDDAYTRLTELLLPNLTRYIRARFGERNGAEDLAWEVLVKLWVSKSNGARYDRTKPFQGWLLTVVRNHLTDRGRRDKTHKEGELPPDDLIPEEEAVDVSSPEWLVEFARQHADCRKRLSPTHAAVYDRHCIRSSEGGSVMEVIADPLGLTYGEANSRLHAARVQMRECLKRHGFVVVPTGEPRPDGAGVVCLFRDRTTGGRDTMLIYTPPTRREY